MAKKSGKCVMPSSVGDAHGLRIWFLAEWSGGPHLAEWSGGPHPENLWIQGPQVVHSNAFLG